MSEQAEKRIKVIVADDEEVFREGLARLLKEQPHIEVVFQCKSGKEAIEKSKELTPDVLLIGNGTSDDVKEAVKKINEVSPGTKVAVIFRPDTEQNPLEMLKAGAKACLAKTAAFDDLIKSVDLIASGRIIISPFFADKFIQDVTEKEKADREGGAKEESVLSEREIEIAALVAEGATNKEIAESLVIAENTVKVHIKNILNKLDLRNRQQLAVYAALKSWVKTEESPE